MNTIINCECKTKPTISGIQKRIDINPMRLIFPLDDQSVTPEYPVSNL